MSLIYLDTDAMKSMSEAVRSANEEINSAAELMRRVTSHNDWTCRERTQINESLRIAKKAVEQLCENNSSFISALFPIFQEFMDKENGISGLFDGVENLLKKALSITPIGGLIKAGTGFLNKGGQLSDVWDTLVSDQPIMSTPPGGFFENWGSAFDTGTLGTGFGDLTAGGTVTDAFDTASLAAEIATVDFGSLRM